MEKTWTQEEMKTLVSTNKKVALRALFILYNRQTKEEQESYETKEHNGQGFNAFDANLLTSIVQSYCKYGHLTTRQYEVLHKALPKYSKQLAFCANRGIKAKVPTVITVGGITQCF